MNIIEKQRSKFNVDKNTDKRTYNNIIFASELEMKYYRDMVLPQVESGDIVEYDLQRKYELQPKFVHDGKTVQPINYVADFFIKYKDGSEIVVDTKGNPDTTAILKRKLFWYVYPTVNYVWITYSKIDSDGTDNGWVLYEKVKKGRAMRKREKKLKELNK